MWKKTNLTLYLFRHVQIFLNVLLLVQLFPVPAETVRNPCTEREVDALTVTHDKKFSGRSRASTPES